MSITWIIVAFAVYLGIMLAVGFIYSSKNKNAEDYFLGGRQLGGFVAALSAQASDMSGWLLMGLPGAILISGMAGDGWIAIGLLLGTIINWIFIASRLRKYTIKANNSVTIPMFFENRFHDKSKVLMIISSVVIVVFFTVYCASALSSGGKLFNQIFGLNYTLALTIGAAVILIYTFFGGFFAVCTTDFIQGTMMLIALMVVPIAVYVLFGAENGTVATALIASGVSNPESFVNPFIGTKWTDIVSGLAWGLGYFGMPHILVRFMAIKNEKEMKKSKIVAITWVTISLAAAAVIGIIGRAYIFDAIPSGSEENIFIIMIQEVFENKLALPFVAGIFLCGILAAIMSTADSQLLVSASSVAEDIFKGIIKKDASDKTVLRVSRITIVVIAIIAYLIALDPESSVMKLVSNAWAGLGAAFGPLVLASLFLRFTNIKGAVAGILSGALTVIVWDYIPMFMDSATGKRISIGTYTGIYSLLIGFFVSLLFIIIVSLCTKGPSQEIKDEFDSVEW